MFLGGTPKITATMRLEMAARIATWAKNKALNPLTAEDIEKKPASETIRGQAKALSGFEYYLREIKKVTPKSMYIWRNFVFSDCALQNKEAVCDAMVGVVCRLVAANQIQDNFSVICFENYLHVFVVLGIRNLGESYQPKGVKLDFATLAKDNPDAVVIDLWCNNTNKFFYPIKDFLDNIRPLILNRTIKRTDEQKFINVDRNNNQTSFTLGEITKQPKQESKGEHSSLNTVSLLFHTNDTRQLVQHHTDYNSVIEEFFTFGPPKSSGKPSVKELFTKDLGFDLRQRNNLNVKRGSWKLPKLEPALLTSPEKPSSESKPTAQKSPASKTQSIEKPSSTSPQTKFFAKAARVCTLENIGVIAVAVLATATAVYKFTQ